MMPRTDQPGFSLVEVIIAMLILTMGVLAMGASTGYFMSQVQASELRSERTAAVRQAAEILGGTAWESLETVCQDSPAFTTDHFEVDCEVQQVGDIKRVRIISLGPGFRSGRLNMTLQDTFAISFAEPVE